MDFKRRFHSLIYMILPSSTARGNYVRKHKLFGMIGKDVRLPSGHIPLRAENIYLHNNIEIAAGAKLVPHDAISSVFNKMDNGNYPEHIGKIEIYDNVFIGLNAVILGPCTIGPNAIVAAGAVVNKDVPQGSIVGGVPAREIGRFESLMIRRRGNGSYDRMSKNNR